MLPEGEGKNKFGIGAKVKVTSGGTTQIQELINTRGYQSSVDFNLNFGIGKFMIIDRVEVVWPNQKSRLLQLFNPIKKLIYIKGMLKINRVYEISNNSLFQEVTPIDFTQRK